MDAGALRASTGWEIRHLATAPSTNDVAAGLLREGAGARTAVVADEQTAGRGREGRAFASPVGGLYVSLLVDARPEDRPARVVALAGVAAAEAIESETGAAPALKWPNDLLLGGRKVGGILLEAGDPRAPVVLGIGINVRGVPAALPGDVGAHTTALDEWTREPVDRGALLAALLRKVDAWSARRDEPDWAARLESAWRRRLAFLGEAVTFRFAGRTLGGVLEDASLAAGLLVRDPVSGPIWRNGAHVQDLRPSDRTIS